MFAKLAFRNLRRQTSSYIVYFITVIIAVAMMFAVNNMLFADKLWACVPDWASHIVRTVFILVIAIVTLVVCVIICYATAFLLRKRKKEFGTYMLLGIERGQIKRMFIAENLVIGVVSFTIGCLLGVGVFWALNMIVCAMMDGAIEPMTLSPLSVLLTVGQWAAIIGCSLVYCSGILERTTIGDLIVGQTKERLRSKYPWIEWIVAVVAFVGICVSAFLGVYMVYSALNGGDSGVLLLTIPVDAVVLIVSIFLFYICLRSVYVRKLMRKPARSKPAAPDPWSSEKAACESAAPIEYSPSALKEGNIFYLRQMSHSMNSNAVMIALIAVLLSFAIMAVNMTFLVREINLIGTNSRNRFDVYTNWRVNKPDEWRNKYSPEEIVADAEQYSEMKFLRIFYTYDGGVLALGDYNAVAAEIGEAQITLSENEYCLLGGSSDGALEIFGRDLSYAGSVGNYNVVNAMQSGAALRYVVPDPVITDEVVAKHCENKVLLMNTVARMPWEFNEKYEIYIHNRYREIDEVNSQFAIIIISALFLGVTFMLLAMALLSVKALSDADADRTRYGILGMLGVSAAGQRRMLFKQQFNFLVAPLVIPLLLTAPLIGAGVILSTRLLGVLSPMVFGIGFGVPLLFAGIYAAYFAATYYLSVKTCIKPREKPRLKLLGNENTARVK